MNLLTTPRAEIVAAFLAVEGYGYAADIDAELAAADIWCDRAPPATREWTIHGRILYSAHHGPGEVGAARAAGFEVLT